VIRSMTGFGEASAQVDGIHYFVELRSLNNKYFKAVIRLPDQLQGLEADMESQLRKRLDRGTITLSISCSDDSANAAYEINTRALQRYIDQLKALPQIGADVKLDLGALLDLPGVLQPPGNEEQRLQGARKALSQLLEKAINGLIDMRRREGGVLREELLSHRQFIATRLACIAERAPTVVADYEKRLKTRIDSMIAEAEISIEPGDLIREIAVYAERTDIAEEIARLNAHLDQFGELLTSTDDRPLGRTLDFLSQEMLREANTIASKSPDAGISKQIVEVKGAIDRIKEQAQNVE
jgi:uncharacterized protein (TIGR00255 family)